MVIKMENLQIAICEDSLEEQQRLLAMIETVGIPASCAVFNSGEAFLQAYIAGKYDLIFMDIYMAEMTGIETVTVIRQIDETVPIAFVTTSTDHTLESYRLDALKYIEKPVKEKAVLELLQLAQMKKENSPHLNLKIGRKDVSISFERILYAEQKAHTLYLFLTGGEVLQANEKLDNVEKQFAGQPFFRCHKSFLVNLSCVKALNTELMVFAMKEGKNVHIRRESMGKAKKAFEAYLFERARRMGDE